MSALGWIVQTEVLQINAMGYKAYNEYLYDRKDRWAGKIKPNTGCAMYRVVGKDGKMERIPIYTASYFRYKETKKERTVNRILLSVMWVVLAISLFSAMLTGTAIFERHWAELMDVLAIPAVVYLGYTVISQLTADEEMRVYKITVGHIRLLKAALATAIFVTIGLVLMIIFAFKDSMTSLIDIRALLLQGVAVLESFVIIYFESTRKIETVENNYEIPEGAEEDYVV